MPRQKESRHQAGEEVFLWTSLDHSYWRDVMSFGYILDGATRGLLLCRQFPVSWYHAAANSWSPNRDAGSPAYKP
jgi:hypothetical protein